MAAKKKAVAKSATAKKAASAKQSATKKPASGGGMKQPPRPDSLKEGGRYRESYGPLRPVGNPGAGVFERSRASDYIRPPLTMNKSKKGKK